MTNATKLALEESLKHLLLKKPWDSSLMLSTVVLSDENRTCEVGEDVIIEINSNLRENKLFKRLFEIFLAI